MGVIVMTMAHNTGSPTACNLRSNYAVFKDGKQASKSHSTREAVWVEAYEMGAVVEGSTDFGPLNYWRHLADGYTIEEVKFPHPNRAK